MFTWIPIHEEAARRLLEFKDRNHELIAILARMKERNMVTTKIIDRGADGSSFQLKEIDPFSFLANFNRGTTDKKRRDLWGVLKEEWRLASDLPGDFEGIPLANSQNSWLMPYAGSRTPEHVPLLWKFFGHIMAVEPELLDTALMQRCLALPNVGMASLTMGMFWACPKKWIATDKKNVGFAEQKGAPSKPVSADEYLNWLTGVREVIGGDGVEFSRQAHLWATEMGNVSYGYPFNKLFQAGKADQILEVFKQAWEIIAEEISQPEKVAAVTIRERTRSSFSLRINVGMWASISYHRRPSGAVFDCLLPMSHPDVARQGLTEQNAFRERIEGVAYAQTEFPEQLFFERFAELWPEFAGSLRNACRHFDARPNTAYRRFHRAELVELISDEGMRPEILRRGVQMKLPVLPDAGGSAGRRYWLIAPGEAAKFWDHWLDQNIASIGWREIGDLMQYENQDRVSGALEKAFQDREAGSVALMLWNFSRMIREGDVLFAKLGRSEVIGWGVVQGGYTHDPGQSHYPNLIPVQWQEQRALKLPEGKLLPIKSLTEITSDQELLDMLAKTYAALPGIASPPEAVVEVEPETGTSAPYGIEDALSELFMPRESLEHILEQLKRKKNIILQGAPGVGKTFIAKRLAWLQLGVKDKAAVEMVQFHQSYTYEDFVQGLRPTADGHFAVRDGCFYRLCRKALANPQQDYFLVIDEINRGNLSKILGELMMLIETDKRGEELTLAYSEDPFTVPPNLYLIGTMNTADRSLSMVDYALRRRFAFLTLDPGFETEAFSTHLGRLGITPEQVHQIRTRMGMLNHEISRDEANLGAGYRIGHSFFTPVTPVSDFEKWFLSIIRHEIMPLLEEYWIDDPSRVQQFRNTLTGGMS